MIHTCSNFIDTCTQITLKTKLTFWFLQVWVWLLYDLDLVLKSWASPPLVVALVSYRRQILLKCLFFFSGKSQLLEQKKLQEENKHLKEQSLCIKCKKNDVCIVFLPCGHLVTCETCAPTIKYCTVEGCGKYIKGTVRTYLA